MKTKTIAIIAFSPLYLLVLLTAISNIANLLSQPSDMAVLFGVAAACVLIGSLILTIKFTIKYFKPKQK